LSQPDQRTGRSVSELLDVGSRVLGQESQPRGETGEESHELLFAISSASFDDVARHGHGCPPDLRL
jgi:hypothetical protein